jgi:hypothetical protein
MASCLHTGGRNRSFIRASWITGIFLETLACFVEVLIVIRALRLKSAFCLLMLILKARGGEALLAMKALWASVPSLQSVVNVMY